MCSPIVLNEHNIIAILDTLRTSFKSKREVKLFDEVAEAAWKTLELEETPNPILLENMLIETIEKLYNKPDSELPDDDARREQARKYDVSLLMFGLLAGYYHTELKSNQKICVPLKERYDRYLHTDVFTSLEYPSEGNYKEIKAADKKNGRKQSRPLNLIMSIARECKTEIGAALLELINSEAYKNCSQEAVFDKKTGQRTDLPKPRFTLENFCMKKGETKVPHKLGLCFMQRISPFTKRLEEFPRFCSIHIILEIVKSFALVVIAMCFIVCTVQYVINSNSKNREASGEPTSISNIDNDIGSGSDEKSSGYVPDLPD